MTEITALRRKQYPTELSIPIPIPIPIAIAIPIAWQANPEFTRQMGSRPRLPTSGPNGYLRRLIGMPIIVLLVP